jgi:hypothetical protein
MLDAQLLTRSKPPFDDVAPQLAVGGLDQRARLVFQRQFFDGIDVSEVHGGVGVDGTCADGICAGHCAPTGAHIVTRQQRRAFYATKSREKLGFLLSLIYRALSKNIDIDIESLAALPLSRSASPFDVRRPLVCSLFAPLFITSTQHFP